MTAPPPCPSGKVPLDAQRAQQLARRSSARNERAMTHFLSGKAAPSLLGLRFARQGAVKKNW